MSNEKKIKNSLQAIVLRISDKNTFQKMEVMPQDGRKGKLLYEGNEIVWVHKNKKEPIPLNKIADKIVEFLAGQDGKLEIIERGTKISVDIKGSQVKISFSTIDEPVAEVKEAEAGTRQQFIKAQEASHLLKAIGIMNTLGEIPQDKRRKYYQIDRFVELLDNYLKDWPNDKELVVVDCGCGKSYLSFVLNYYLQDKLRKKCYFIGIDGNKEVIAASEKISEELGYRNMEFHPVRIEEFHTNKDVSLVLSLHACDIATDQQLGLGVRLGADHIIAVPCCQKDLRDQLNYNDLQDFARFPILKNRLSDVITDGIRVLGLEAHGYKVNVVEYISPLETPKNIMIRAEKKGENTKAQKRYDEAKKYWGVSPAMDRYVY
ncbi:SAM-dependent methyltransferase [Alkalicella caledoniensis]|uniref:SAM-dependent methyltransferase n=1 Tax=Alkalicella caledoniensis TaxID=2731377 RepID=A0A7G9WA72_ALKCA|nr:SAM-dependent methyltransferase [Alkalicella caledoniensis]QNO15584.1 SAM-dependent methyltransferase [Alkalicella caledoniensis]